jgi:hypothetical protein
MSKRRRRGVGRTDFAIVASDPDEAAIGKAIAMLNESAAVAHQLTSKIRTLTGISSTSPSDAIP